MTSEPITPTLSLTVPETAGILVLVVGSQAAKVSATAELLRDAGWEVAEATTFQQARALMFSLDPDLLITDVQLGAFNGLHLVWQRQLEQQGRPSIVLNGYADPVLEAEARRLGAPFLIAPVEPDVLIATVDSLPGLHREDTAEKRQWIRSTVESELGLVLAEGPATLVDVSYAGCRLRFPQGAVVPLSRAIQLPVPTSDLTIRGTPVWHQSEKGGDIYGLSVNGPPETERAWRTFVDGLTQQP